MPYIGRDAQTAKSQNKIIDDISSSFNGSTTSFALLVGGVAPAPFPVTSQNLLISVGGVIQEPDGTGTNGYQLTGANIVFSAAPASGQSFFGVILAGADYVNAGANFPDGDAGTPSITFSQDLDTGLFRSGSGTTSFTSNNNRIADFGTTEIVFNEDGDDINFRVEGDTEANLLFVDAGNDRVGVGTNSPSEKLEVRGSLRVEDQATSPTIQLRDTDAAGDASITQRNSGDFAIINGATTRNTIFETGGSERMRINSSGNVGIATTSPSEVFEVLISPSNISKVFTSTAGGGSVFAGWNIDGGTNTNARAQYNWHHGSTNVASMYSAWNGSSMTELAIRTFSNAEIKLKVNSTDRIRATGSGAVINGSLSKSSGSFKIDHPLPSKAATHDLVHSFVEAPDASNLYAGMVDLVDGTATVNIDTAHRMTEGTFEALNTVQSWSSSNETGYAPVKCSISGNLLTIVCQDVTSTDTVYYEVRGIRKDQHMLDTEWTDENGRVITEPLKD